MENDDNNSKKVLTVEKMNSEILRLSNVVIAQEKIIKEILSIMNEEDNIKYSVEYPMIVGDKVILKGKKLKGF